MNKMMGKALSDKQSKHLLVDWKLDPLLTSQRSLLTETIDIKMAHVW